MRMTMWIVACGIGLAGAAWGTWAGAQTAQVGAAIDVQDSGAVRVDHVHYRPARWNRTDVTEYETEYANLGGMLYVYLTNVSDAPVQLRYWRYNNRDESFWVLNNFVAWHRMYRHHLEPGEQTVLEICAVSRDFGPGTPYSFELVDGSWSPCLRVQGALETEPVAIAFIRFRSGLREADVFLRHGGEGPAAFEHIEAVGGPDADVTWRGQSIHGPGMAIARMTFAEPLERGALQVFRVHYTHGGTGHAVYAHRRAFPDYFPVGTWGVDDETQAFLSGDHVDAVVKGGRRDDAFFSGAAERYGFYAMVHTGEPVNVDMVRDLSGHPRVACWMLRDEPDWSTHPQIMLFCDETVRAHDRTIPTFINLCRNAKFFEYAAIPDIAGHDHYCVSAPSSSVWPEPYGTHLEETAYYTEDLKYAAEPRPTWVWSQGNHDGWSERPLRPLPTPEELSAQLVLNLGRGAKGILWFTYNFEMSQQYPETRDAMRDWNRVMHVLKDRLLSSEPTGTAQTATPKIDVAVLAGWDSAILCVTNLDYEIHPEAYPFTPKERVEIDVDLPEWLEPKSAHALREGVTALSMTREGGTVRVTLPKLEDAAVIVLSNDADELAALEAAYAALRDHEAAMK